MWRKHPAFCGIEMEHGHKSIAPKLCLAGFAGQPRRRLFRTLDNREPFKEQAEGMYPALDAYRNIGMGVVVSTTLKAATTSSA